MPIRDFFVSVSVRKIGINALSGKVIRQYLEEKVCSLDADAIIASGTTFKFDFNDKDWAIQFEFIPKKQEARGKTGRTVGMICSGPARFIDSRKIVEAALKRKSSKYGSLRIPYIIALNFISFDVEESDLIDLIYGRIGPAKQVYGSGRWFVPKDVNVSAILSIWELFPWNVSKMRPTLWHHPLTCLSLPEAAFKTNERSVNLSTRKLVSSSGDTSWQILDI